MIDLTADFSSYNPYRPITVNNINIFDVPITIQKIHRVHHPCHQYPRCHQTLNVLAILDST